MRTVDVFPHGLLYGVVGVLSLIVAVIVALGLVATAVLVPLWLWRQIKVKK